MEKVASGFAYGVNGVEDILNPMVTFSYQGSDETIYELSSSAPVAAGTYLSTALSAGNYNYNATQNTAAIAHQQKKKHL
ncbi:MAG: hypothetical protein U5K54_01445 [Cytophagales bacterium]|nr:hypothetical protein [Cytophagales bacterium]